MDRINTGGEFMPQDPGSPMRRRIIFAASLYLLYFAGCLLVEGISRRQYQVRPDCEIPGAADRRTRLKAEIRNAVKRRAMEDGLLHHGYEIATVSLGVLAGLSMAVFAMWKFWPRRDNDLGGGTYHLIAPHILPFVCIAAFTAGSMIFLFPVMLSSIYYDSCFIPAWLR